MTLKTALKISIKKWEILQEGPKKWGKLKEIMPELQEFTFECPLCSLFICEEWFGYKHKDKHCPLYEEKAPDDERLCCEDFHDFVRNIDEGDFDGAKEYAKSILQKLKSALEEENKK